MPIVYIHGNALYPIGSGKKILAHICNNKGYWGAGFSGAVSSRWKKPEKEYRNLVTRPLGRVQVTWVNPTIFVANLICQVLHWEDGPPIRYWALEIALNKLAQIAKDRKASIHLPKIGCGLAGGSWDIVSQIIENTLIKKGCEVYVYEWQA